MTIFFGPFAGSKLVLSHFSAKSKLVLSHRLNLTQFLGHIYSWSVPDLFSQTDQIFDSVMTALQTFVSVPGHDYSAPYWMGEFGTCEDCDQATFGKVIHFLRNHDLDWSYWTLDGYQ